jgi:hypothetical protein
MNGLFDIYPATGKAQAGAEPEVKHLAPENSGAFWYAFRTAEVAGASVIQ